MRERFDFELDFDAICWAIFGVVALAAIIAGIGWMVWADMTQQCFGPAYNEAIDACVKGHATLR